MDGWCSSQDDLSILEFCCSQVAAGREKKIVLHIWIFNILFCLFRTRTRGGRLPTFNARTSSCFKFQDILSSRNMAWHLGKSWQHLANFSTTYSLSLEERERKFAGPPPHLATSLCREALSLERERPRARGRASRKPRLTLKRKREA